ncbi:MAG: ABC transporter ATP-binding protein [Hyphomicrobiales bacterium]|nr:MAG: ABC transporter ATP-binding protein [Hyphomicrobiales bacterium]|tara:strand:- start:2445 stop:3383 length:939 start_codon:yes stop_codon:yes gene_type:complete
MENCIVLDGLYKSFGDLKAVNNVSMSVEVGEILGFIGPNGSGKSTTMKMATGYLKADAGTSTVCGVDMENSPKQAKKLIGYLPEGAPAYGEMTTIGFLNFIADIRGFYGKQRAIQIDKAVERARIKHVLHQQIDTLSKGYKRRVGLSQAIMHEPKILILDEPTDGLDPNQKHHVRELITEISKTTAIIVSTHILEEVDAVCSSVLLINKGNVVLNGSSSELRSKVDSNNSIMIKIDPKSTEDLKRLLLTIPNISKIEVLNETGSNVNINVYPKENRVILTEVAKIIADHKFPVRDIYQNHIALDEAFRKLTV